MYLFELCFFQTHAQEWNCWSYGSSIFSFLRNLHIVLPQWLPNVQCHQKYRKAPFFPHPLRSLLFVDFLMMTILTALRWYLIVVLICISLIISNIEHFFSHEAISFDHYGELIFFKILKNESIYFNWRLNTLQYCGGFCHTLTWISHGCTCPLTLSPSPTSLPIPSHWVVPEHQLWVPCFMHRTCAGHLFHIW